MGNDALWHEVDDAEKETIRKDMRRLLDEFASKLEQVKLPKVPHRDAGILREESSGWNTDSLFQDLMFGNAPLVEDNLIVAERGKWKKK